MNGPTTHINTALLLERLRDPHASEGFAQFTQSCTSGFFYMETMMNVLEEKLMFVVGK